MTVYELDAKLGLDASDFNSGLDASKKSVDDFTKETENAANKASSFLNKMGTFGKAFFGAGTALIINKGLNAFIDVSEYGIEMASTFEELQNVIDVTFGKNADAIYKFSEDAIKNFGMSEVATLKFAGAFGSLFESAGMSEDEVLEKTKEMVGLVSDLSSFHNISLDESFSKVLSGLSGETKPLKVFGVDISVENLREYAKSLNLVYDELSSKEKYDLRANYLLQETDLWRGDFLRTRDSYENEIKTLQSNLANIATDWGQNLLNVATSAVSWVNEKLQEWEEKNQYRDIEQSQEERVENLYMQKTEAMGALSVIEQFSNKTNLAEHELLALDNAYKNLLEIFPELSEHIDAESGKLLTDISLIKEYVDAKNKEYLIASKEQELNEKNAILQEKLDNDTRLRAEKALADATYEQARLAAEQSLRNMYKDAFGDNGYNQMSFEDYMEHVISTETAFSKKAYNSAYYDPTNEAWKYFEQRLIQEGYNHYYPTVYSKSLASGMNPDEVWNKYINDHLLKSASAQEVAIPTTDLDNQIAENNVELEEAAAQVKKTAGELDALNSAYGVAAQSTSSMTSFTDAATASMQAYLVSILAVNNALLSMPSGDSSFAPKASGLGYVPYDGYRAELHRGEKVLTRQEAEQYRMNASNGSGITATELVKALEGVTVTMDGATVGHLTSRTVSSDIASNTRGRR